ncbi:MAG: hypothetical protein PsegKO_25070 [Pseudohongiellaceae bacterium]
MTITILLKKATSQAKAGNYNGAIEILDRAIRDMSAKGGFPKEYYVKIIPYLQKAGRYEEISSYSKETIIPAITRDCKKLFSHKSVETVEAFVNLGAYAVFDKCRLCAEREGVPIDVETYLEASKRHYDEYKKLLEIAHKNELEEGYREAVRLYGSSIDKWPRGVRRKYIGYT